MIASLNAVSREDLGGVCAAISPTRASTAGAQLLRHAAGLRDRPGTASRKSRSKRCGRSGVAVKIPVAVKLSVFYSNPLHLVCRLDKEEWRGFVLFNRFFQPDINVDAVHGAAVQLQHPGGQPACPCASRVFSTGIKADVCASTGIMTGKDVAKMILAGAAAVQVVTALYRNGVKHSITAMLEELTRWMESKSYAALDAFRGKLSAQNSQDPWAYTRAQYAKMLLSPKEFTEPVGV